MKTAPTQFLGPEPEFCRPETAAVAILPFPYEGGVSYGRGTAEAPQAILEASCFVEFYDEVLKQEPHRMGIVTLAAPDIPSEPQGMHDLLVECTRAILRSGKFPVVLGGDHSISSAMFKALKEKYPRLSCVQLDAHGDLRDDYEGSKLSHASVMARIREMTPHALQLGIRALSLEEAQRVAAENFPLCTMHEFRNKSFNVAAALAQLPDPVFLTVDVDAFDLSVIQSTGTPEPGGFTWDEGLELLRTIFFTREVVGFDIVELSHVPHDRNSPFAAARLVYKMLGYKLAAAVQRGRCNWPVKPAGNLFD